MDTINFKDQVKDNDKFGIFTSIVRIEGANRNVIPVKSTKPIRKKLWIECSKALSRLHVGAPITAGDIICKNILNTKVDIVATRTVEKCVY
ncbi:DUF1667 domain-containing protein [Clostridium sp. cel8]|jgi:CxxC motif-containing protein|uniref:DUF1667 domain-containing protein n=1 Tax=unclassified Clostridium TaxID=2614128 RepID=UPI0015F6244E|nr:DUF1667 domain-containing protein [Clostridium sp. cel8]MBA5851840.1 DUF1667 domain-containing protein [Clostridium sp. cel8]